MAKTKEETFAPDEPRPMTWSGVEMWRCPVERCGYSHEDQDAVIDHIRESGHLGPDAVESEETDETSGTGTKGGKS